MKVLDQPDAMQKWALDTRGQGRRIAFVPTMGALHDGHLSLIRLAREAADAVVVSIFVNPLQFAPREDLARYPRPFERDRELCARENVCVLFAPASGAVYADDHSTFVDETRLTTGLCGASRPGHFRGVCTVVVKLFHLVMPHVAVFGQKDAQQAAVIRRVVRDLHIPVRVVLGPIVRDPDGLAMSSRNAYLDPEARRRALALKAALDAAEARFNQGLRDGALIEEEARSVLRRVSGVTVEYVAVVDAETLDPVRRVDRPVLLALAASVAGTRLIDNVILTPGASPNVAP